MWTAIYTDDTKLSQFAENNGQERLFKDIELDKLSLFEVQLNGHIFGVSMSEGAFRIDDVYFNFEGFKEGKDKFKLIYFRRVRQTLSMFGGGSNSQVQHCLGWQVEGQVNRKRIMKVQEENLKVTFETK